MVYRKLVYRKQKRHRKKDWQVQETELLTLQEAWWVWHYHTNLDNHSSLPLQVLHSLSFFEVQNRSISISRNSGRVHVSSFYSLPVGHTQHFSPVHLHHAKFGIVRSCVPCGLSLLRLIYLCLLSGAPILL